MIPPQSLDSTTVGRPPEKRDAASPVAKPRPRTVWLAALGALVFTTVIILILLRYGGTWLVKTDPLPTHADVAVMLDGSVKGVIARRAGAVRLLQRGVVDHIMLSMESVNVWGQNVPEVAHNYFLSNFGSQVADRIFFCFQDTDSTLDEALGLRQCLEQHNWRSVIVVTSQFHTRRAGMIWRKELAYAHSPFKIWIYGVDDPNYNPNGWWRKRRYAKTWLLETTKVVWTYFFGYGPWS